MDTLTLTKAEYPQEKIPLWSIPASKVLNITKNGRIPQIRLSQFNYDNNNPKIAIILAQDKHPDREENDYTIFPDYVDAIIEAGANPFFIAYGYVSEQLKQIRPDGILLIGGNFRLVKNSAYDTCEPRPLTYMNMIDYATHYNIPTFAICGGEQMMAVYKGAGVNTHINKEVSEEHSHKKSPYVFAHEVNIIRGSLMHKIMQTETILVNSCHNSAITPDKLGDCLVTGTAPDGIIEVVEMKHPWNEFVLAVQWHPERTAKINDETSLKLFAAFVEAANNYRLEKSCSL